MSGSRWFTLCGTSEMPRPRRRESDAASCRTPSNQMRPRTTAFGSNSPKTASTRSVLPEPDAPTTATISPACTEMLMSSMTGTTRRFARKNGASSSYMRKPTSSPSTCSKW